MTGMKMEPGRFRFGAHQFLWKSHWTDADLAILDAARRLGCTLFEISLGDDVAFDRPAVRRHAAALGLELTVGPGNRWPADCNPAADDPACRRKGIEWHQRILGQAAELGAVACCGALYGYPGYVCRRRPPADEWPRVAESLHELAGFAAGLGIRLVIEPMSRFRTHLVNTAAQAVALLELAAHDNLRINLDTYHMVTEERDYAAAIRSALPVLWGVHACASDRGGPGGGIVPWPAVLAALGGATGCVRLMLESYNTGPGDLGYARGIFKNLCPDPEQFVREGMAFLGATGGVGPRRDEGSGR